ncbi:MAG: VOC family protein [bacterium]
MPNDPGTAAGHVRRSEPESLRARSLTASLSVNDLQASLAWYRDVLGFNVAQAHERNGTLMAVSLQAGSVHLLINQDDGAKGADRAKGAGFSMMLTTVQDIDEIAARVRASGGTLDSEPADMPWGVRAFRLSDPNGFKFVISSPRPGAE